MYHPLSAASYERKFQNLMGGVQSFNELIALRKAEGRSTYVLDLFGSGVFITEYDDVDGIVGARVKEVDRKVKSHTAGTHQVLVDSGRISQQELVDYLVRAASADTVAADEKKRTVVETNLYSSQAKHDIAAEMERRAIPAFDIIVCKPAGAFVGKAAKDADIDAYRAIYFVMLQRAYAVLSDDEGQMFIDVPSGLYSNEELQRWADALSGEDVAIELDLDESRQRMKIMKRADSPKTLPALEIETVLDS